MMADVGGLATGDMDDDCCLGQAAALPAGALQAAALLPDLAWRKSRRSNPSGNCVELARLPAGQVAVRNSRHAAGPVLICTRDEMAAFVRGAKDGHFDGLLLTAHANTTPGDRAREHES
jgi:hypothetical protein